jgi:hypothetical protein
MLKFTKNLIKLTLVNTLRKMMGIALSGIVGLYLIRISVMCYGKGMYILNPKQDGGLYSYYEWRGSLDFWWDERCRGRHFLDGENNGNSEDLSENVKSGNLYHYHLISSKKVILKLKRVYR